jgi:hypothetical protein
MKPAWHKAAKTLVRVFVSVFSRARYWAMTAVLITSLFLVRNVTSILLPFHLNYTSLSRRDRQMFLNGQPEFRGISWSLEHHLTKHFPNQTINNQQQSAGTFATRQRNKRGPTSLLNASNKQINIRRSFKMFPELLYLSKYNTSQTLKLHFL